MNVQNSETRGDCSNKRRVASRWRNTSQSPGGGKRLWGKGREERKRVRESRLQVGVRENVLICRTGSLLGPRERVHLHKEPRSILGGEQ